MNAFSFVSAVVSASFASHIARYAAIHAANTVKTRRLVLPSRKSPAGSYWFRSSSANIGSSNVRIGAV